MIKKLISEIKETQEFEPITMVEIKSYILPIACIAFFVLMFAVMSMHGHQYSMATEAVPFSSGYMASPGPSAAMCEFLYG